MVIYGTFFNVYNFTKTKKNVFGLNISNFVANEANIHYMIYNDYNNKSMYLDDYDYKHHFSSN